MPTEANDLDVCIEITMSAPPCTPPPSPLSTLSMDSSTELQCYICLCEESPTMKSYCQCKATVHKECLIKSINALQCTTCSICKTEIQNVETVKTITSLNVTSFVFMATPFILSGCVLGTAVLLLTSGDVESNKSRARKLHTAGSVLLGTFFLCLVLWTFAAYVNRRIPIFVYSSTYRFNR